MVESMIERVAAVLMGRVNAPEAEIYATARAAIEAMREPTDAMFDAAYRAMPADGDEIGTDHIDAVWPNMIDAVLNEQVSG